MKRQGRVLHFAVTGVLLGGVGIGCSPRGRGPHTNTRHVVEPDQDLHVNPGPDEDPGAADGGAADGGAADGGAADGGAADGGAAVENVNPGPQETPPTTVAEPEPEGLEPSTNNVRKVEEPRRKR